MLKVFDLIALLLNFAWADLRQTPEKEQEKGELEISRGILELNAKRFSTAEAHFKAAIQKDPRNFVAREYMAASRERQRDYRGAIAWLVRAKHLAPEARSAALNYQIGRLYIFDKNEERAEIYLKLALQGETHKTATHYLLGHLYFTQKKFLDAELHLHEARMRTDTFLARDQEKELSQATHFYLGEIYARQGYTKYAINNLRKTEYGESWEIRRGAWALHSELNRPSFYLNLGAFAQYDSNVVLLPVNTNLPGDYTSQGTISSILSVNGGAQTSPTKPWVFGADSALYMNNHMLNSLSGFDVFNIGLDGWVEWWNRQSWSVQARYDLSRAWVDRSSFDAYQMSHGPGLSVVYVPFERWNWEVGLQMRTNTFEDDLSSGPDRRNGTSYIGYLRAALKAPNPRLRPSFGYNYETDDTVGLNFRSKAHHLMADLQYRLGEKTYLLGGLAYKNVIYRDHLQGRTDYSLQGRLGVNYLWTEHWMLAVDLVHFYNSSALADFSYRRTTFSTGAVYRF